MEGRLLLKGCSILGLDGQLTPGRAILVENGRISKVAADAELPIRPGDWEVACAGRVAAPGFVDGHAHLAGGLVAPLSTSLLLSPAEERCRAESERLRKLSLLELEIVSGYAMARSMRLGVTTVVEHLCYDADVGGGLRAQAAAAERVGIRFVGAPGLSSASGRIVEAVEASAAHALKTATHPTVRGALGFYASVSADDELLGRIARARDDLDAPICFHLAEDEDDLAGTFARLSQRVVPRLRDYGLLGGKTLAAHGRALDRGEVSELARLNAFVAMTPTLDLTGEPASGGFEALFTQPSIVGLGTSGTASLYEQLAAALSRLVGLARIGRMAEPDLVAGLTLAGSAGRILGRIFGARAGVIEEGAVADLVVFDAISPIGPDAQMPVARRWIDLAASPVAWCIVDGRVTVREGQLVGNDYVELAREAARVLGRFY